MAEGAQEARREQLHVLGLCEGAGLREERLKAVLKVVHRAGALAGRELAQWIGAEWWSKMEVEQLREAPPGRSAILLLDVDEPQLCSVQEVVGGHPQPSPPP